MYIGTLPGQMSVGRGGTVRRFFGRPLLRAERQHTGFSGSHVPLRFRCVPEEAAALTGTAYSAGNDEYPNVE